MRLAPQSMTRPLLLVAIGGVLIFARLKQSWWRYSTQLYDEAAILVPDQRRLLNAMLGELTSMTGVDLRIITTRSRDTEPIEMYSLRRMRELEVGSTTDRRGLLLVLDMEEKRARLEVGPNLEGIMTDTFAGYVARDVLTPMLARETHPPRMIYAAMVVLRFRINQGQLGQEWDSRIVTEIRERQRLALGGGADAVATLADLARLANQPAPARLREYYRAQPTAAEALKRYQDWVLEPFCYYDVEFLSPGSGKLLSTLQPDISAGAWRYDQLAIYREQYHLVERGRRAIGIPTRSPLSTPVWLVRDSTGWRYDVATGIRMEVTLGNSEWTWGVVAEPNEWTEAFGDLLVQMPGWGVYRFRDGNNTPIPGRGSYR